MATCHSCEDNTVPSSANPDSCYDELILARSKQMTEKELTELKKSKPVEKTLKYTRNWAILAAAVSEKHSRIKSHYIGWDGLDTEKESDRGKVGRIYLDQREELNELKNMHLVKRVLEEDKDISHKTKKLFPLPSPKKRVIISDRCYTRSRERIKKSVRAKSQAIVDTIFSVPSKRKRVLERLTAQQLQSIGKAESKRTQQISPHYIQKEQNKHRLTRQLPQGSSHKVVHSDSDEHLSDDTLDPPSEQEYGSTNTLADIPPMLNSSLSTPSPLLAQQVYKSEERSTQMSIISQTRVQIDGNTLSSQSSIGSTSSGCYSSRSSSSYNECYSSQSTQSSFEIPELEGGEEEEEEREVSSIVEAAVVSTLQVNELSDSQSSLLRSMTNSIDEEVDTPSVNAKPLSAHENRNSWSWLEPQSTGRDSDTSFQRYLRQSIASPDISDTPLDLLDNHPLSSDSLSSETAATKPKPLPQSVFEDPRFVEYCQQLNRPPTVDDYVAYKLVIVGELIEEKYGKKLEDAMHEMMIMALKDKLIYKDFFKISHKLALQAKYVQEQAVLITCLGRRMFEKMPSLEEVISEYTSCAIEEMTLLGLDWMGDTPFHNPEMRWDYDDWKFSNVQKALIENSVSFQVADCGGTPVAKARGCDLSNRSQILLTVSTLQRANSVEVLSVTMDDQHITSCSPPSHIIQRRRCSWGNMYTSAASATPPSDHMITAMQPTDLLNDHVTNESIMKATSTDQVSLHLETFRNRPSTSKPIVLSLSTQSSIDSVAASSIRSSSIKTIRGRGLSSVSSNMSITDVVDDNDPFSDLTQPIVEEVEEEETGEKVEEGETEKETGEELVETGEEKRKTHAEEIRRTSSARMISEAMTSPVLIIGLPIAVLAAIAMGRS